MHRNSSNTIKKVAPPVVPDMAANTTNRLSVSSYSSSGYGSGQSATSSTDRNSFGSIGPDDAFPPPPSPNAISGPQPSHSPTKGQYWFYRYSFSRKPSPNTQIPKSAIIVLLEFYGNPVIYIFLYQSSAFSGFEIRGTILGVRQAPKTFNLRARINIKAPKSTSKSKPVALWSFARHISSKLNVILQHTEFCCCCCCCTYRFNHRIIPWFWFNETWGEYVKIHYYK